MRSPDDDFPSQLSAVAEAMLTSGPDAARRALLPIAMKRIEVRKRPTLPPAVVARIFRRDSFTCRYCGGATIPPPVLRVVSSLFPDLFPYHKNWKADSTHPAYLSRASTCDHVLPGARPESRQHLEDPWTQEENLLTACWLCNMRKADLSLKQLGWTVKPPATTEWDGLTAMYEALWNAAEKPDPNYHRPWLAAFSRSQQP
jgi:5-methylcytosine-specific restriction endonuclease McrA